MLIYTFDLLLFDLYQIPFPTTFPITFLGTIHFNNFYTLSPWILFEQ